MFKIKCLDSNKKLNFIKFFLGYPIWFPYISLDQLVIWFILIPSFLLYISVSFKTSVLWLLMLFFFLQFGTLNYNFNLVLICDLNTLLFLHMSFSICLISFSNLISIVLLLSSKICNWIISLLESWFLILCRLNLFLTICIFNLIPFFIWKFNFIQLLIIFLFLISLFINYFSSQQVVIFTLLFSVCWNWDLIGS